MGIIHGNNRLILFMNSCGASLVVLTFTGGCFVPMGLITKDGSKINLKGKLLCVISSMGGYSIVVVPYSLCPSILLLYQSHNVISLPFPVRG